METYVPIAVRLAEANVQVSEQLFYASFEQEAKQRIPRDPDDGHTVALTLALGIDIWTQDRNFLGCGAETWTTDTSLRWLGGE